MSATAYNTVVRGIVPYQNGLAMVQKARGRWDFPGGKVEPGEDPVEALLRELPEETGLTAKGVTLIASMKHLFLPDAVALYYLCHQVSGQLENREPDQHLQVARRGFGEVCGLVGRNMPHSLSVALNCPHQSRFLVEGSATTPRLAMGGLPRF